MFDDGYPAWVADVVPDAEHAPWAPDVAWFDGRWHLYYSVSSFGINPSAIGVATNTTLDPSAPGYNWVDHGPVVTSNGFESEWNAIDPNVIIGDNGVPWLSWGSFWGGIKLARLDPHSGKLAPGAPVTDLAIRVPWYRGVEAPFIVKRGQFWYLFASFGYCCRPQSNYNVRVGRSTRLTGPYLDHKGVALTAGGGTLVLGGYGDVRGPGHNAVVRSRRSWSLVHHYYDAGSNDVPTLSIRPLLWTDDAWPVAADPGFEPAPEGLRPQRLAGTWRISGYDADLGEDLFAAVPNLPTREVVLRSDGTVVEPGVEGCAASFPDRAGSALSARRVMGLHRRRAADSTGRSVQ